MFVYPYKAGSKSATALAAALKARVIRLEGSTFKGRKDKLVINWGNSMTNEELEKASVLNHPSAVRRASNKLEFFNLVKGKIPIPDFTTDMLEAYTWLEAGDTIVVRETLTGHSGAGITLLENKQQYENYNHKNARMYVRYIPKKEEYRVHVVDGKVIDVQQKRKHKDAINPNWKIRNHHTGFIYARENVALPSEDIAAHAIEAVNLANLHFGAVDVIWNNYRNIGYILEVNTAPGLEGETVEKYSNAFSLSYESFARISDVTLAGVEFTPEGRRPVYWGTQAAAQPNIYTDVHLDDPLS